MNHVKDVLEGESCPVFALEEASLASLRIALLFLLGSAMMKKKSHVLNLLRKKLKR